jgi:hypothetical protein
LKQTLTEQTTTWEQDRGLLESINKGRNEKNAQLQSTNELQKQQIDLLNSQLERKNEDISNAHQEVQEVRKFVETATQKEKTSAAELVT